MNRVNNKDYIEINVDKWLHGEEMRKLSLEEKGVYSLLLFNMHLNGGKLPNNFEVFIEILRIPYKKMVKVWHNIEFLFEREGEYIIPRDWGGFR